MTQHGDKDVGTGLATGLVKKIQVGWEWFRNPYMRMARTHKAPHACRRASQSDPGASRGIAAPSAQTRAAHLQAPPSPSGAETGPAGTRTLKNGLKRPKSPPSPPHVALQSSISGQPRQERKSAILRNTKHTQGHKSLWACARCRPRLPAFYATGPPPAKNMPGARAQRERAVRAGH
jgi:hypothetical protein